MPIHAPFWGFWGTFPPNDVIHRPNPKKDHPWAESRHLSHKTTWKSVAQFELGVWTRKKDRTGQDRKKWPICGEASIEAMYMKICVVSDVLDLITCAKFQSEIFKGLRFYSRSNCPFFLLISNGPYNSAALLRCLRFQWDYSVWCAHHHSW